MYVRVYETVYDCVYGRTSMCVLIVAGVYVCVCMYVCMCMYAVHVCS